MADVEQMKKIVPFVTCGITFGQNVCELMFGVNVFDLDFGIMINPVKQPIQNNSVGSWNMSHCGASSLFMIILITASLSSKTSRLMERDQCWSDRDWCAWLEYVSACLVVFLPTFLTVAFHHLWFCWFGLVSKDRQRESHPCVNLHRERLLQLP